MGRPSRRKREQRKETPESARFRQAMETPEPEPERIDGLVELRHPSGYSLVVVVLAGTAYLDPVDLSAPTGHPVPTALLDRARADDALRTVTTPDGACRPVLRIRWALDRAAEYLERHPDASPWLAGPLAGWARLADLAEHAARADQEPL